VSPKLRSIQFHDLANGGMTLPLQRLRAPFPPCPVSSAIVGDLDPVQIPEWRAGETVRAIDAPVVLCKARFRELLPIRLRLERRSAPGRIELRATDASGCNLLGAVEPFSARFEAADVEVQAHLNQSNVSCVAAHDDVLQWQWRENDKQPWQDLTRTHHRVCITLDLPQTPWDICSNAPWIEVIEKAASWASGAVSVNDCAARIARAVFALGEVSNEHPEFSYNGLNALTSDSRFDCASLLAALAGCDFPQVLDCTASASIVCTFANSLGAGLLETSILSVDDSWLLTRPIRCVGQAEFNRTRFNLHEVASTGSGAADLVWDGCLQICRAPNPEQFPHGGLNASGMALGDGTPDGYLWRLLAPGVNSPLQIIPAKQNRGLGSIRPAPRASGGHPLVPRPGWFYWNFRLIPEFLEWKPLRNVIPVSTGALTVVDSIWSVSGDPSDKVQVVVESHPSHADAFKRLIVRKGQCSVPLAEAKLGDHGVITLDQTAILMVRGNLFIEMHSAGPVEHRMFRPALRLDRQLIQTESLSSTLQAVTGPISLSDILPTDPFGVTYWYRVHADTGEIRVEEGVPYLHPVGPGAHQVFVYGYDPSGQMTPSVHTFQSL